LCGAVRGMHHALRGDLGGALGSNALLALIVPATIVGWVWWMRRTSGHVTTIRIDRRWTHGAIGAAFTTALMFTVLRNTGTGHVLAP
jgi:hypothetical protein